MSVIVSISCPSEGDLIHLKDLAKRKGISVSDYVWRAIKSFDSNTITDGRELSPEQKKKVAAIRRSISYAEKRVSDRRADVAAAVGAEAITWHTVLLHRALVELQVLRDRLTSALKSVP